MLGNYTNEYEDDADDEYEDDDKMDEITDRITDVCKISDIFEENKTRCVKELVRIIKSYYPTIKIESTANTVDIYNKICGTQYLLSVCFLLAPTQLVIRMYTDKYSLPIKNSLVKPKNITEILECIKKFIGSTINYPIDKNEYLQNNPYTEISMVTVAEKFILYK